MLLSTLFSVLKCFYLIYLRVMGNGAFPPVLSSEEEKECFRLCKNGDEKARGKLIEHNLRLVAHIIKKYYTSYKDQEDLISIGTIGLIKAIDTYDPENGTKFATYAGKCLQNEILMYFRSQKRLSAETSINDAIEFDKDGNPLTYLDIMYVEDDYAELVDMKTKVDQVKKIIVSDLDEREKNIIIMRYGLSGCRPVTQREAAEKLHISRSYVSRIEKAALEKIRRKIKS